jgi:hypothetical protein
MLRAISMVVKNFFGVGRVGVTVTDALGPRNSLRTAETGI